MASPNFCIDLYQDIDVFIYKVFFASQTYYDNSLISDNIMKHQFVLIVDHQCTIHMVVNIVNISVVTSKTIQVICIHYTIYLIFQYTNYTLVHFGKPYKPALQHNLTSFTWMITYICVADLFRVCLLCGVWCERAMLSKCTLLPYLCCFPICHH
jgi:hypothetical protein